MPYPPPPPVPAPAEGAPAASLAVRIAGAGLVAGGLLIVALVVAAPVFVGGSDSWRWLDAFAGAGSNLAPVGAFVLVVTAAATILGGIPVVAVGRRVFGHVGAVVGVFAGTTTIVCGLIFVFRLIGASDLGRTGPGMWGLFPIGLWCLGFGIVGFVGGRKQ